MNSAQYVKETTYTDLDVDGIADMADRSKILTKEIHYALGMVTEAAEVADIIKKGMAYGKAISANHMKEELGDLLWYLARMAHTYGWSLEELMEVNISKLRTRYGTKFTPSAAINRDLDKELAAIEGVSK